MRAPADLFGRRWGTPYLAAAILILAATANTPLLAAFNPAGFTHHEEVTLTSGSAVLQLYSIGVTIDTAAMISQGLLQTDGRDLAVAWDQDGSGNWKEIDAHVRPAPNQTLASSTATQVWFAIQEPAGVHAYPYAGRYRIYTGDPGALLADRLRNGKNVYRFIDEFNGTSLSPTWYFDPDYAAGISVGGGLLHIDGSLYPTNPALQWFGKPTRLVTMNSSGARTFTTQYTSPFAMETRYRSMDLADDVRPVNFLMNTPINQSDLDEYLVFIAESTAKGGGALASDNFRMGKVLNQSGDPVANSPMVTTVATWYDVKATVWPVSLVPGQENVLMSLYLNDQFLDDSSDAPTNPYDPTRTKGAIGLTCDPGTRMDVDWTIVRDFTPVEPVLDVDPVITLFASQGPSGTALTWTTTAVNTTWDVMRGNVSALSEGGGVVHLGPTTCIENDSIDATTSPGNLDTVEPSAGSAWFYLVRARTPGGGNGGLGYSSMNSERMDLTGPGCAL